MTNEQAERLIGELERIADSLEILNDLAMGKSQMSGMVAAGERDHIPVIIRALDHMADMSGLGK